MMKYYNFETPKYYCNINDDENAMIVLKKIYNEIYIDYELRQLKKELIIKQGKSISYN